MIQDGQTKALVNINKSSINLKFVKLKNKSSKEILINAFIQKFFLFGEVIIDLALNKC